MELESLLLIKKRVTGKAHPWVRLPALDCTGKTSEERMTGLAKIPLVLPAKSQSHFIEEIDN
jgi:hypothetical protein